MQLNYINDNNIIKYTPEHLKIIKNEKIQYDSNIIEHTPIKTNKTNNSIEQCRFKTKNTNFVSKIISNEISSIRRNTKLYTNVGINDINNNGDKNLIESIFNLSIMNKNDSNSNNNKNEKNVIIFKNDNIGKYRYIKTFINNIDNKNIPNYLHFDKLKIIIIILKEFIKMVKQKLLIII